MFARRTGQAAAASYARAGARRTEWLWTTWLSCALWASAPRYALAHEPEEDAAAADEVVGAEGKETEIIVSGQRASGAASAVVRDRKLLGAAPHATASELLRTVPGVFVSQHSGQGKAHQIFFRGFDAVHGQDVEIWVAGAPVNEVSHVHGQGYADLHFVMPEVVQRIEAMPGSYLPSQGDFAVAGTMRFSLGYDEPGATLKAGYGSFGTRRLFLGYRPTRSSVGTFGAFELFETDGFGVGRGAQRASTLGQFVHPVADDLSLRVMASSYIGRFGSAGVLRQTDVDSGLVSRFDSYDLDQGGRSARSQLVAELAHDDGLSELVSSAYVVLRQLDLRYNYTGYLTRPELGDTIEQQNDSITAGFRGHYRQMLDLFRPDDALELGVAARNDWIDQGSGYASGAEPERLVDARLRTTTLSSYVDAELHPWSRLLVRGGLRADMAAFTVEDRLSSRPLRSSQGVFLGEKLIADLALRSDLHAVFSWGRGFRSPQARGVADGARVPFTEVRSAELGLRWAHALQRASLASYVTDLSNDMVFDERVARNESVPGTRRLGIAANFETTHDFVTSGLGATVTQAAFRRPGGRFEAGDLVPYVPQVVLRSDVAVRPRLGTFRGEALRGHAGFGVQGLFRRPLPYGEFGRDAVITDVRLGVRTDRLELNLDLQNVFAVDWNDGEFVYASRFDQGGAGSLLPARHFTAGAPLNLFLSAALHL